jgi:hypothetical protein
MLRPTCCRKRAAAWREPSAAPSRVGRLVVVIEEWGNLGEADLLPTRPVPCGRSHRLQVIDPRHFECSSGRFEDLSEGAAPSDEGAAT